MEYNLARFSRACTVLTNRPMKFLVYEEKNMRYIRILYRVVKKKENPLLAAILKYFLEVMNLSVYIFGKFRLFYVSGEEIVEKMQE